MSTPLLAFAIVTMVVVVLWYVLDEATRGGEGRSGILGMNDRDRRGRKNTGTAGWKRLTGDRPWRTKRH